MPKPQYIKDLEHAVGDARYVVWRPEDLLLYEYDGSIDRAMPGAVVLPGDADQAAECVRIANRYGLDIVPRGAGTGLSGGAIPLRNSLVIALTRLSRILEVDVENRVAIVEPGVVNLDLTTAVAKHGLYYAPDPSSQRACTIGGNVAENAGGPHCLAYGVTTNHVMGVEVVLADGTIVWLGGDAREWPGYDLRGVFIGSEGTLGIATKIAVRLLRAPEAVKTLLAAFRTMDDASQAVSDIIAAGIIPAALEMMDAVTIKACEAVYHPGYPADAEAVLIVEVDGLREHVAEESEQCEAILRRNSASEIRAATDAAKRAELWATRKGAIGAMGTLAPNYYLVDGVSPRTKLKEVMRTVRAVGDELGLTIANVFHAGDGNIHPCILFDERKPGDVEKVIAAGHRILKACVEAGGALSGEHGIGIEKQAYMGMVFTPEDLEAMMRLRPAFGQVLDSPSEAEGPGGGQEYPLPLRRRPERAKGKRAGVRVQETRHSRFNPGKIFPGGAVHGGWHEQPPAQSVSFKPQRTGGNEIV
ncbi:MAG: FAD-binding protein [Dehalococcoidia bacterium]|nr:FAD-binding protein [Dehalococcoidia bacterium]MSQ34472.1 FAD-binding protein [Dehalococcoidia bacterium]